MLHRASVGDGNRHVRRSEALALMTPGKASGRPGGGVDEAPGAGGWSATMGVDCMSMVTWASACILAAAVFVASAAPAPAGDRTPSPPRVSAAARLVEVDLVAADEEGRPVVDLKPEDLVVLDEGRAERIASFSGPSSPAAGPTDTAALPRNAFTNRLERRLGGSPSVTAILLDGLNTPQAEQTYARRQVLGFLRQIPPGGIVSLYTLGRGLSVLEDFSRDPETLVRALEGYRGELSTESAATPLDATDVGLARFGSWLEELDLNLVEHYAKDRALRTIRSLVAIAQHLERVPGRKSLVWVSGSFPAWIGRDSVPLPRRPAPGEQSFWPEIERAARALSSSNLAIYPVDARGLRAPTEYSPARARIDLDMKPADRSGIATMEALAARTGGRAFYNTNDLAGALREADRDARAAYRLGYEPSHDEWKGEFHRIEVRCRRPGVRLRHRSGYFAQPAEPTEAWYRSAALDAAMWSPVDATEVGLTVRVTPSVPDTLNLEIRVRAKDVSLQPLEHGREAKLDVWFVQLGPGDAPLDTVSSIADVRLGPAEEERVARTGDLVVGARLRRKGRTVLLRVLVRDVATGALGAVSIPLERVVTGPAGGPTPIREEPR
jgi:VWFA-related protein